MFDFFASAEPHLAKLSFVMYIHALAFYFVFTVFGKEKLGRGATGFLSFAALLHAVCFVIRAAGSGSNPFSSLFGTMTFLALCTAFIYLVSERIWKFRKLGLIPSLAIVVIMTYASRLPGA